MGQATTTTDHDEIRRWADDRGGRPSVVRTGRGEGEILRFDFGEDDEKLEETTWEEFFRTFENSKLAFLQENRCREEDRSHEEDPLRRLCLRSQRLPQACALVQHLVEKGIALSVGRTGGSPAGLVR